MLVANSDPRSIHDNDLPDLTAANPIVVSDDEQGVLDLLKILFERHHLRVICVDDAFQALELCRTQPVSLLISDVAKPGMDGFELLQILRADPQTAAIPVIFFSARCYPDHVRYGLELGAEAYIPKPIENVSRFIEQVKNVLLHSGNWQMPRSPC